MVSSRRRASCKLRYALSDQAAGDAEECLRSGLLKRPLPSAMLNAMDRDAIHLVGQKDVSCRELFCQVAS